MPLPPFKYVSTGNPAADKVQDAVRDTLRNVLTCPLLDGELLEGVVLTTSFQDVAHGLERAPQGCLLVRATDAVSLAEDVPGNPRPSSVIRLKASSAATVSLWVF
jgi:hypothetical protein